MKQDEVLKGAGISILGAYGIYWTMTQPCTVNLTQQIYGQTVQTIPQDLARLVCLSTDPKLLIILTIASAALFAGVTKVVQNV